MQTTIWTLLAVALALVIVGALAVFATAIRKSSASSDPAGQEKHPQGYWMSIGISIGIGFGVALGTAFEDLALGIATGTAIGAGFGAALEHRNKDKVRPLTEQEKERRIRGTALGLIVLLIFVGAFGLLLVMKTG